MPMTSCVSLQVILCCLATFAGGSRAFLLKPAAQSRAHERHEVIKEYVSIDSVANAEADILSDHREDHGDGNFRYSFETTNGIQVEVVGQPGSEGQSTMRGSYR